MSKHNITVPVGINDTGSVGQRGNPSHHTGFSPATACCHFETSGSQLLFCGDSERACLHYGTRGCDADSCEI